MSHRCAVVVSAVLILRAPLFAQAPAPSASLSARPSGADAFALAQALSAEILASQSATATLETWCRDHHLADTPRVVASVVAGAEKKPSPDQLRRLAVASDRDVTFRRVRLECGTHVLSQADNWYVPARLTAEMNRLLKTTDTPFGRAVAPLQPTRRTFAVRMLWSDSTRPAPEALFEHDAVLSTRDGQPFAEVAEVYRRDVLDFQRPPGAVAAQQDVRNARRAQNEAIASGDLDRAATFWTDDVTVRRALGQPVSGRAEARRALEPAAAPAPHLVYQRLTRDVDVSAQWPLAFETGTWDGHLDSPTGPVVIAGRFSAQWVQRGGRWLIRSEVFVALSCAGTGCQSTALP